MTPLKSRAREHTLSELRYDVTMVHCQYLPLAQSMAILSHNHWRRSTCQPEYTQYYTGSLSASESAAHPAPIAARAHSQSVEDTRVQ